MTLIILTQYIIFSQFYGVFNLDYVFNIITKRRSKNRFIQKITQMLNINLLILYLCERRNSL